MLRIAIVEDHESDAKRLTALLEAYAQKNGKRFAITWIANANTFLDSYQHQYELVFMDIRMPGLNGMMAAHELREMDHTVVLMLLLYWFINHTRIGTAIRAVAIDQDTAKLMGINVDNIISMIFLIGPALGGAAGVMMGLYYGQITYDMGFSFGLKAFTAAIMGGIGNIPGAMVGGILLGVLEAMGAAYVSIAWKDAIAFLVLILILIFRPTGLLGERVAEKI